MTWVQWKSVYFHRYMLLFNYPGIGEQGLLTGSLGHGFTSPETAKVEAPMWQAHKTFENLGKEGAATAALSWYRCFLILLS